MSNLIFFFLNPFVRFILNSRFHPMMSSNTALLQFQNDSRTKLMTIPASYRVSGSQVHCFSNKTSKWWRNLTDGKQVKIILKGKTFTGRPNVIQTASETAKSAFRDFLLASPRDASHAGVRLNANGHPNTEDIENASNELVFISIDLETSP